MWSSAALLAAAVAHSLLCCALFVASLYAVPARVRALPRDAPEHIGWRIVLVLPSLLLAPALTLLWLRALAALGGDNAASLAPLSALEALGVAGRCQTLAGALAPPLLAAALFLGPLVHAGLDAALQRYARAPSPPPALAALRTLAVAPLAEEWVFRACVLPVYAAAGAPAAVAVLGAALAFGAAHVHHVWELRRAGRSWRAAAAVLGQVAYTSLFGALAASALLRTGSVAGVVLMHAFCNYMGFPDFGDAAAAVREPRHALHAWRWPLAASYLAGIALFLARFPALGSEPGAAARYPCALARTYAAA